MKKVLLTLITALTLIALVACSNPTVKQSLNNLKTEGDAAKTANLIGSTWKWTEKTTTSTDSGAVATADTTTTDPSTGTTTDTTSETTYTVTFTEDGKISFKDSSGNTVEKPGYTDYVVFNDKFYFEANHDDDSDFFDADDFEYYIDNQGRLVVDEFVEDMYEVDDDLENTYIGDLDGDEIPFTPVGGTNGREGTWQFSFKDKKDVTTTITLVISSDTISVVSEKTIADGTSQPEMLATYSYVEDLDDDTDDDKDDDQDDETEALETELELKPQHVYLGFYFDDAPDSGDDHDGDDNDDDDDDDIRFTRDQKIIEIEKITAQTT